MRALVISGGGCKGAFAVGAIEYLLEQQLVFDIIVGTSTGALIAPLVAGCRFAAVKEIYGNVHTSDLIKKHCWITLPWRSALYSDAGLRRVIDENYSEELHELLADGVIVPQVAVCTVSLNTGKVCYWSPKTCTREKFCRALSASSNQPGLMPPRQLNGEQHVDGGVREIVPIEYAVELGATEVVSIVLEPSNAEPVEDEFKRIPAVLLRSLTLMTAEIRNGDIPEGLNLIVIRPKEQLIDNSLRFNPAEMREMMRKGYAAAERTLS